ncbi:hypothetical protein KIN20_019979 [Parelaphostrongylus tenuis]|uniref:Uncharacterized protein n=1 Tax=Parelaphostrongylus tenuis TaxID=148309 RepID=A0AAD5QVB9_PARTN|nr:hypothetical protein KIN20_019979 [Parelaphostrongylus tenuis]
MSPKPTIEQQQQQQQQQKQQQQQQQQHDTMRKWPWPSTSEPQIWSATLLPMSTLFHIHCSDT